MNIKSLLIALSIVAICVVPEGVVDTTDGPQVTFDSRPEIGIPKEAQDQPALGVAPTNFMDHLPGPIAKIRVRYFDTKVWSSEQLVSEYIRKLFNTNLVEAYSVQIWSQPVFYPEIECFVEFGEDAGEKLKVHGREGRLLVWGPVACYRDENGRWFFLSCYKLNQKFPSNELLNVKE